jgi:hypothetical protein
VTFTRPCLLIFVIYLMTLSESQSKQRRMNVKDKERRLKPDSLYYRRNCLEKLRKTTKLSLKLEQLNRVRGRCPFRSGPSKGTVKNLCTMKYTFSTNVSEMRRGCLLQQLCLQGVVGKCINNTSSAWQILFVYPALPHLKST